MGEGVVECITLGIDCLPPLATLGHANIYFRSLQISVVLLYCVGGFVDASIYW